MSLRGEFAQLLESCLLKVVDVGMVECCGGYVLQDLPLRLDDLVMQFTVLPGISVVLMREDSTYLFEEVDAISELAKDETF